MAYPMVQSFAYINSPLGRLTVYFSSLGVCRLLWPDQLPDHLPNQAADTTLPVYEGPWLAAVEAHLKTFFEGKDPGYPTFPLDVSSGTAFQQQVWQTLLTIPHGETRSYTWVGTQLDKPKAFRAVGQACGQNPIPIVIPCHRVLSQSGHIGGFCHLREGAAIDLKRRLIHQEQLLQQQTLQFA